MQMLMNFEFENLRNNKTDASNMSFYTRFVLPLNVQVTHICKKNVLHKKLIFMIIQTPVKNVAYQEPTNLIPMEGFKGKSYWINKTTIMCEPDRLIPQPFEIPRINYLHNGRRYNFVYGVSVKENTLEPLKVGV